MSREKYYQRLLDLNKDLDSKDQRAKKVIYIGLGLSALINFLLALHFISIL